MSKIDKMYFSYDHEDGIEFHETAASAKARAEAALDGDRDYADEGWHEEVESICWGEIKGRVTETLRRPVDPERDGNVGFDEYVDYAVKALKEGGE